MFYIHYGIERLYIFAARIENRKCFMHINSDPTAIY